MNEQELTKEESLKLITDMIGQAKRNFAKGGSFYFLLWGWVVMLANLGHYVLSAFNLYDRPYMVWLITIPAAIMSIIYSIRIDSKAIIKSHIDSLYSWVWLAMFVSVLIILFYTQTISQSPNPVILVFAGAGTFISGAMLRFTPLMLGGVALWISSIAAFNLGIDEQYLAGAIGIFAGYLIPGYLLKRAENA